MNRDELGVTLAGLAGGTFRRNFLDAYGASVTVYNEGNCSGEVLKIPGDVLDSIYISGTCIETAAVGGQRDMTARC